MKSSLSFNLTFLILSLLKSSPANTQSAISPEPIIQRLIERMDKIRDYKAEVQISIDIPFLKIPIKKAIIYYRHPNKFHLETKGLSLFPKAASGLSGQNILKIPHTAIYVRKEQRGHFGLHVIKIVPMKDTGDVVLSTLYISEKDEKIYRVETITRNDGWVNIDMTPGNNPFGLPDRMVMTFEIPRVELPAGFTGDVDVGLESSKTHIGAKDKKTKGTVAITYTKYDFNIGLGEDIFKHKGS